MALRYLVQARDIISSIRNFPLVLRIMLCSRIIVTESKVETFQDEVLVIRRSAYGIAILYHSKCVDVTTFSSGRRRSETFRCFCARERTHLEKFSINRYHRT